MAKISFLLPLSVVLIGSTFLGEPSLKPAPFRMRVVDEQTDVGVPYLRVATDNGIVCYTGLNGDVTWGESSLMSRVVRFEIRDERNQFANVGATLMVMHSGQAALKVHRRT
jgi:hypothetical protein